VELDAAERSASGGRPVDWREWNTAYDSADSPLARRLKLVQGAIASALDRAPTGPVRVISICAGEGQDLIGVLAEHPRRADVSARLVELDRESVLAARSSAAQAGLEGLEIVEGDASLTDAYAGAVPAEVVLLCGVLGNISESDVANTIAELAGLCAAGATVIWTRHRNPPDLVPGLLETFGREGFEEVSLVDAAPFAVGAHRLTGPPRPLREGARLFEFIGHRALWPHLDPARRTALGALFRPDCSLLELVEAMRALAYGRPSEASAESMLREARGTAALKHLFLAQLIGRRFAQLEPVIVHRVHSLSRERANELFGAELAAAVPAGGFTGVHRYLTILSGGQRIALDVTLGGSPWDGVSALEPACGPGRDVPAGSDPDADERTLEQQHCDPALRAPFLAALSQITVAD
jgi:hypothetical protein